MTHEATNLHLVSDQPFGAGAHLSARVSGDACRAAAADDERSAESSALELVAQIEGLLAARHVAGVGQWEALSDELVQTEQALLRLPRLQLREAAHALLTLLHQVVENEGLEVEE